MSSTPAPHIAFYDESGRGDKTFTLAAWAAPPESWRCLEERWKRILSKSGIQVLHMRDLSHRRREFAKLSRGQTTALMTDLIDELVELRPCGIAVHFKLVDYSAFLANLRDDPEITVTPQSPYHTALQYIASAFATGLPRARACGEVTHVVSEHPCEGAGARSRYLQMKNFDALCGVWNYGRLTAATPRERMPLQAADLLAYETDLRYYRRLYEPTWPVRTSMQRLDGFVATVAFERHEWDEFRRLYKEAQRAGFLSLPSID